MSFWTDFEVFLQNAVTKAEAAVSAAFQYVKPMVVAGAEEVAQLALQEVLKQAPLVLSGAEKLNAATAAVVSTLATQGKRVAINIAETAVQGAYNKVSSLKPAP